MKQKLQNAPSFNFIFRIWCSFISFCPNGREKCGWCNSAGFFRATDSSGSIFMVSVICCSTRNDFDWFGGVGADRASLHISLRFGGWMFDIGLCMIFSCVERKWEKKFYLWKVRFEWQLSSQPNDVLIKCNKIKHTDIRIHDMVNINVCMYKRNIKTKWLMSLSALIGQWYSKILQTDPNKCTSPLRENMNKFRWMWIFNLQIKGLKLSMAHNVYVHKWTMNWTFEIRVLEWFTFILS